MGASGIGGVGGVRTTTTDGAFRTEGSDDAKTGAGVAGGGGASPDPEFMANVAKALSSFLPKLFGDSTRLAEITTQLKEVTTETEETRAQNQMETKRLNTQENQGLIDESEEKLADAQAKRESGSIWDKIALAFSALAAVLMIALGAVLGATPLGVALIVAGGLMLLSVVNSIVSEASEDGMGIGGQLAKAFGADDETAAKWDQGIGMTIAIASAIAAIAVAVISFGSSAGAALSGIQSVISAASSGAAAGSGVSAAVSSGYKMSAAQDSADAADAQAEGMEIQAFMQQLDALIDQALSMLIGASDRFNAMMDSIQDMAKDNADTMSSVQFAG